jgi:hypothetical protein
MKQQLCLARDVAVLEPKVHTLSQTELQEQSARATTIYENDQQDATV